MISHHEKSLSLRNATLEYAKARKQVASLARAFPKTDWLIGNHDALTERQAVTAGLPPELLRDYAARSLGQTVRTGLCHGCSSKHLDEQFCRAPAGGVNRPLHSQCREGMAASYQRLLSLCQQCTAGCSGATRPRILRQWSRPADPRPGWLLTQQTGTFHHNSETLEWSRLESNLLAGDSGVCRKCSVAG